MAYKRYISTDLPKQSWYIELPPRLKSLYIHLICECDCAGSFEITPRTFSAFIGEPITEEDIFKSFGNRVVKWQDRGLLVDFIRFQYYSKRTPRLSPNCKPHEYVLQRLKELGLTEAKLDELGSHSPQLELGLEIPSDKPKEERKRTPFKEPTVEEVAAYCAERKNGIDANEFVAYYGSRGWEMKSGVRMKDWKRAIIYWETKRKQRGETPATPAPVKNVVGTVRRKF